MLRILSAKKLRHFYENQIGKTVSVLFENENKNGHMLGFSSNYLRLVSTYDQSLCNVPLNVKVTGFNDEGNLLCSPVQESHLQAI